MLDSLIVNIQRENIPHINTFVRHAEIERQLLSYESLTVKANNENIHMGSSMNKNCMVALWGRVMRERFVYLDSIFSFSRKL